MNILQCPFFIRSVTVKQGTNTITLGKATATAVDLPRCAEKPHVKLAIGLCGYTKYQYDAANADHAPASDECGDCMSVSTGH